MLGLGHGIARADCPRPCAACPAGNDRWMRLAPCRHSGVATHALPYHEGRRAKGNRRSDPRGDVSIHAPRDHEGRPVRAQLHDAAAQNLRVARTLARGWQDMRHQFLEIHFLLDIPETTPRANRLRTGRSLAVRAQTHTTSGLSKSVARKLPCSRTSQPRVSGRR